MWSCDPWWQWNKNNTVLKVLSLNCSLWVCRKNLLPAGPVLYWQGATCRGKLADRGLTPGEVRKWEGGGEEKKCGGQERRGLKSEKKREQEKRESKKEDRMSKETLRFGEKIHTHIIVSNDRHIEEQLPGDDSHKSYGTKLRFQFLIFSPSCLHVGLAASVRVVWSNTTAQQANSLSSENRDESTPL